MDNIKSFESILYTVNETNFDNIAIRLFHFQAVNNPVYSAYLSHLKFNIGEVDTVEKIPFLPISFFKTQNVQTGTWDSETSFLSSTTTGNEPSIHRVKNLEFYKKHSQRCFEYFFGPVSDFHFFALLPSYLERSNSSLVVMMDYFISESKSSYSGFFLSDTEKLLRYIEKAKKAADRKIILWGVSFALLDLAETVAPDLSDCLIFETGGMKGRRAELTRQSLHAILKSAFGVDVIHSEYGMTEMFSQSYTRGGTGFFTPPWMKLHIRELGDPFSFNTAGRPGGINVIDLANIHSVAFLETDDAGVVNNDGSFEVQGRLDNNDVRGCNLLVE